MHIGIRFLGLASIFSILVGGGIMAACTTDKDEGAGGAGGTAAGGNTGAGGSTTPATTGAATSTSTSTGAGTGAGPACAKLTVLDGTKPGITDFDTYDGASLLSKWSFALGGDSSSGIFAGTFGYGDRASGQPEIFDMAPGYQTTYGLRVKDSAAEKWGGGMGIWMSACLDAKKFTGISFWARGLAPEGTAKFSVLMKETTVATATKPEQKTGTCMGEAEKTCVHPFYKFPVSAEWTQVKIPWVSFDPGNANGTPVAVTGTGIWQIQYDIGLTWMPDATGAYAPVPGAYELEVDSIAFY